MKLGAQLYTVRKSCTDLDSFSETLKRVADMGYTTVQVSGTCDYEAEWLAEQLKACELKAVLTHIKPERIIGETKKVCDDHKVFGCRNIGLGMIPGGRGLTLEKYNKFVEDFKPAAQEIVANGCKFFFHNHAEEFARFEDGESCYDKMLKDFTPDELNFTLDMYWVAYAGCDPNEYLRKFKGRLECIHLKDMTIFPTEKAWEHRMAPVGYGNMNYEQIINTAADCDVSYLLVEQDYCYDEDPFECLKKSYSYLRSLGLN